MARVADEKKNRGVDFHFFPVLILLSEYFFLLWCSSSLDFFFVQLLLFSSLNCERVNSFVCISKIHPTNIMKKNVVSKFLTINILTSIFFGVFVDAGAVVALACAIVCTTLSLPPNLYSANHLNAF